jgi:hypothetical protein
MGASRRMMIKFGGQRDVLFSEQGGLQLKSISLRSRTEISAFLVDYQA